MIVRRRDLAQDLLSSFRSSRNQLQESSTGEAKPATRKKRNTTPSATAPQKSKGVRKDRNGLAKPYDRFLRKCEDLASNIDSFTVEDLVFYFQAKAKEAGIKYVVANKGRDCGAIKKVQSNYSNGEICLMIEFLFQSEQDYLDPTGLSPTILLSAWCNKIYNDSLAWANDEYVPNAGKKTAVQASVAKREWKKTSAKGEVKIGEWE